MTTGFGRIVSGRSAAGLACILAASVSASIAMPAGAQDRGAQSRSADGGAERLTEGAWARMLADRTGLLAKVEANEAERVAISLLGGTGPRVVRPGSAATLVVRDGEQRTWKYDVTVPATGVWLVGIANERPAFVSADAQPSRLVAASPAGMRSDVGHAPLLAGAHGITVATTSAAAPELSLVGGCHVVAPAGGWRSDRPLEYGELARTLVQAMRQSSRLPPAAALPPVQAVSETVTVTVPEPGPYQVLFSGDAFADARYRLDDCEETRILPAKTADGWREGGTALLARPGEHTLTLVGVDRSRGPGRIRLVRRSDTAEDHLAVLQAMGVKVAPVAALGGPSEVRLAHAIGGIRRRQGDDLGGVAKRVVTRAEAERILAHPVVRRLLGSSLQKRPPDPGRPDGPPGLEGRDGRGPGGGTFPVPVSPVVPGGGVPDPF